MAEAEAGEEIFVSQPSPSIVLATPRTPVTDPKDAPVTFTKAMADQISAIANFLGKLDPLSAEKKKKEGEFLYTKENILKDLNPVWVKTT